MRSCSMRRLKAVPGMCSGMRAAAFRFQMLADRALFCKRYLGGGSSSCLGGAGLAQRFCTWPSRYRSRMHRGEQLCAQPLLL